MKVNTFSKIGICAGAIALVVGAFAAPAQADPAVNTYGQLVGLGSDTTQDVVDGLAKAITPIAAATAPEGSMASYHAIGDATVVTRAGGVSVPRVNGSSAGRDHLLVAIGALVSKSVAVGSTTTTATKANSVGQIDFARSSSGVSSGQRSDGVITYIPFARDAVTIAIDPDSPLRVVPFVKGTAEVTGEPSLYNIYRGTVKFAYVSGLGTVASPYAYVGAGLTDTVPDGSAVGTTAYAIKPFIPQSGSGTRTYFLAQLGISSLNTDVVKDTFGTTAASVQEHNGAVVDGNNEAIVPFSISQWVAQKNGAATDRTSNAILTNMNAIAPTTGSGTSYKTNTSYAAMVRDVYNIVPSRLADDPNSAINKMFVGATSKVCSNTATIERFGFIPIPSSAAAADRCGSTDSATKRITAPTASTVSLSIEDQGIVATEEFSATVTVTGMHDQGGTIVVYDEEDNELGTGVVAAGSTTATFTVSPSKLGDSTISAYYTPTLPGISGSESTGVAVSVTQEAADVRIMQIKKPKLGASANAVVYVTNPAPEGGIIVLKSGAEGDQTTIGTVTLEEGEAAALFSFTPKALSVPLEATYTAPEDSLAGGGIVNTTWTVAKGTPGVSGTVASVKASVAPKIVVTVTGMAGVKPTGTIEVRNGTTVLATAKALVPSTSATAATSAVTITLPKQSKGTKSLTVVYTGDSNWSTATKTGVVAKITAK